MLRQHLSHLVIGTSGEGFTDLTAALDREIAASGLHQGIATLCSQHTSCSLTINENADPRVLEDLAAHLRALVSREGVRPFSGHGALRPLTSTTTKALTTCRHTSAQPSRPPASAST